MAVSEMSGLNVRGGVGRFADFADITENPFNKKSLKRYNRLEGFPDAARHEDFRSPVQQMPRSVIQSAMD
ncbi:hypothetical protein F0U61_16275 [Archangium violaceum]|nr:hypothetical protein F0U61_16275 [Archangium violaceum]